jgi:hypothetical protein
MALIGVERHSSTETLSLTEANNVIRIPLELRERALTQDVEHSNAKVQAAGSDLHIWIFSERQSLLLQVPFESGFRLGSPVERSMANWGVNVSRWVDDIDSSEGEVEVLVETFDKGEMV